MALFVHKGKNGWRVVRGDYIEKVIYGRPGSPDAFKIDRPRAIKVKRIRSEAIKFAKSIRKDENLIIFDKFGNWQQTYHFVPEEFNY